MSASEVAAVEQLSIEKPALEQPAIEQPVAEKGYAPVKKEYLDPVQSRAKLNLNFVSAADKKKVAEKANGDEDAENEPTDKQGENGQTTDQNGDHPGKRAANDDDEIKANRAKRLHGMNKNRQGLMNKQNIRNGERHGRVMLCAKFSGSYGLQEYSENIEQCTREDCKFGHDVDAYMKSNPVYFDEPCYMFEQYGFCGFGHRCKFGKSHIDLGGTNHNLLDKEKFFTNGPNLEKSYKNTLPNDLKLKLRKKNYDFSSLEQKLGPASIDEREWKRIDFKGKLILAPLTTVGNLPFRRICKEFGADVTCGEMAMAENILQGSPSEWALLRRHASEDVFGVQLCGSNQQVLARATKLINDQCDVDFIDLNMGCPIDFVYQKGAGSGLMSRYNKLSQIITAMTRASEVPITMKMRTGIFSDKPIADKLINTITSQFNDGRIAMITVHGRSRESRYTRKANWDYIRQCATQSVDGRVPIYGSGDVLSWQDYEEKLNFEGSQVAGVMIARGALIKPWLFTEIKERRDWDISSSERMEILKRYVKYGLEQFGSDYEGVEKTRKFLLEWLSFLHRYIPVGLLEVLPQKINERPPVYHGRDDLETLFASSYCEDWIKISEMLLGPVPENYLFLPKHKSNAYV